ncbi:unnamed protein product [Toxocara canis]|uniref:Transmembrane protein n=1 Tax=Toxocara canis TaxID=6265 RepID=A0A183UDA8_TOXCA|nr:unnamed protein product [Toxocara canis]
MVRIQENSTCLGQIISKRFSRELCSSELFVRWQRLTTYLQRLDEDARPAVYNECIVWFVILEWCRVLLIECVCRSTDYTRPPRLAIGSRMCFDELTLFALHANSPLSSFVRAHNRRERPLPTTASFIGCINVSSKAAAVSAISSKMASAVSPRPFQRIALFADSSVLLIALVVLSVVLISVLLQHHCKSSGSISISTLPTPYWTSSSTESSTHLKQLCEPTEGLHHYYQHHIDVNILRAKY